MVVQAVSGIGNAGINAWHLFVEFLGHVRRAGTLSLDFVRHVPLLFKNSYLTVQQMYAIGLESVPLVSVTALFLGAETVVQAEYQFSGIIPPKYLGMAVCKALINELGPVVVSLVVSGRIATAIAAEIGSMKATEQLDAMVVLNLHPIRYLIVPRVVAAIIMIPMLVIWGEFLAIVGSIVTVMLSMDVTTYVYLNGLRLFFNPADLFTGIAKTSVFGAIIALTGAHFGLEAKGGAAGVGNATTKAVMVSAVLILIFDFIIAAIVW